MNRKRQTVAAGWLRSVAALTLLAVSNASSAAGWTSPSANVAAVQVFSSQTPGWVWLDQSITITNPSGCASWGNTLYIPDTTTTGGKHVVATLQTALVSGKKVLVYSVGCSGGGTSGYPTADGVSLYP